MEFTNILSKANTWTLSTSMGSDYVASGDYSAHWIGSNENVTVTLPSLDVTAYRGSILKLKGNAYTSTPKDGPWTGITDSGSLIEVDFRDPEEEEYTTRQFYGAHEDEHEPFNVVDTTVPFEISISIPATTESIVIKLRHCYGSLSSGRTALLQIDDLMCYDASEEYTENPIHFHKVLASSLPTSVDPGSQHIYFAKGEEKTFMYVANNQGELEPISAVGAGGEQIQSDWNQTDATAVDFIRNKPTALSSFTDDLGSNPTHTHSQYSTTTTVNAINNRLIAVEGKIPSQASTTNQLADKSFVNSSIATNTANFLGTNTTATTEAAFLTWANALSNKTNNDYVFWGHSVDGNNVYDRYKYVASSPSWVYEYRLNNSSFTANQWAAINSGITEDLVEAFETHTSDEDVHVTTTEKEIWNGKANTNNPSFTGNVSINGTLKFQNNLTKVTSPTVVAAWVDNDSKKGLGFAQTSDLNVGHSTSADSVPWTGVSGKPDTFPPSSHAHSASDITSGTLDLARIPTIPSTKTSGFATVATSGSYNDLSNKPSIEDITYPYESSTYTGTEDWYIRIRSKNTYLNTNGYVKIHGEGSNRYSDTVICTCTRHNNFWGYTSHYNGKAVAGICSEYEAYNDLYIRVTNGFTSIKVYSTYEVNIDKADYSGKTYFNLPNGGFFASSLKGNLEGVASAAASVNWTGIQNKPSAYPPEAHSHSEYVKLSTTNTQQIESTSINRPLDLKGNSTYTLIGFRKSDGTYLGGLGANAENKPLFHNGSANVEISLAGHTHSEDVKLTSSGSQIINSISAATPVILKSAEPNRSQIGFYGSTGTNLGFLGVNTTGPYFLNNSTTTQLSLNGHTHDDRYYTETEINDKLATKSDTSHTHDDRYYTETEVNTKLSYKENSSNKVTSWSATVDDTHFPSEKLVKNALDGKASSSHTHDDRYYTESEIDTKLSGKSDTGHTHDDRYYTETEVNTKLDAKANLSGSTFTGDVIFNAPHRDTYYASNLCRHFSTNTPTEFVIKTKIKYVSASHMPLIRIHGYAFGQYSPIELKVAFYIYGGEFGWAGAVCTGAWKPEVYLFKYTENSVDYVAVGFKGACYYCGFQVDAQVGALGSFNSNFSIDGWSTAHNGADTSVSLIPAVGTSNCIKVDYKAIKTDISGSAGSVAWDNVTGKPSTYPPSSHNHDDRYYTETEINTKLSGKSDTGHTHDDRYYTESEIDTKLNTKENSSNKVTSWSTTTTDAHYPSEKLVKTALDSKASSSHTHDDRYYTEGEVDTKLSGKSDTGHTHDDRYYTEGEVDTKLSTKENSSNRVTSWSTTTTDTHYPSEKLVKTALDGKASSSHTHDDRYYTETEVNTLLNGKSNTGHTHDDRYYTEGEVDTKLATKANLSGATFTGPVNINAPHADNYYASNLCRYFSTKTPREIVVKTKIKYLSSTYMPVIKFYGYSYGMGTSVDLTIMFYIYGGAYERRSATCTGGWNPDLYLFKYTESGVEYVAVGIKPSSDSNLYYTGFQVDAQVGASGSFGDNFSISGWSTTYNTESTQNIIPAVGTSACVQVSYTSLATSINGSIAWGKITDKPSTFPPSSHNHDDRYYTESEMDTLLDGKANSSHGHAIFDVIGLQTALNDKENSSNKVTSWSTTTTDTHYPSEKLVKTALDGKSDTGHTHSASNITSGTFDLARIPTIPSSKTSGFKTVATSGSYNDLTDKPSIPTKTSQLTNDSGYNKEAYLEWGGKSLAGTYAPIDAALVPELGANRLAFGNPNGITVEYSRNSGSTWTSYGLSDNDKKSLLTEIGSSVIIGKNTTAQTDTSTYQARITIDTDTFGIYTVLNKFVIYVSTKGSSNCWCTIDASIENTPTTWVKFADKIPVSGWSGYNVINTSDIITYGNSPASQYGHVRFTFGCDSHPSLQYTGLQISKILGFGGVGWTTPSTMARFGRIFTYDADQNVNFPAKIKSNNTEVSLVGHTHDDRYYTESEIDTKLTGKSDTGHTHSASNITSGTFALDRIPTIPSTKTSGFATVATSGSYNNLTDKPSIPTKTSQLTNDSGFLTSHQDISGKENSSNKVTSWSTTTTDTHYPSEKLVKTALDNKASLSHEHGNIDNDGKLTTASRALVTDGNKKITTSNITSTELGYLSGVSSGIQSQLNSKADTTKALVLDNATIPEYSTTHNIKVYQQGGMGASVSVGPELLTFSNESEQTNLDVGVNRYTLYVETRDDPDAETYVSATRFLGTADAADSVPWDNVTGKPGTFRPSSHSHSEYVKHRTNGTSYNDLGSYYVGGSTVTYVRVALPSTASTWAMLSYEFTVRENYGTGKIGKILVYGNWSSTAEWNQLTAIVSGSLSTNIKVYASDKKYIYIKGLSSYGGLTLDKVTAGDNITNYDISGIVIDGVSSLPSTYQTATMSYASYSGHTHDDRYYTESEIDTKLTGKSDTGHTHTTSQITNFPTIPSKTSQLTNDSGFLTSHQDISGKENSSNKVTSWSTTTTDVHYPSEKLVKTALDGKANTAHTHSISNVEGLQDALDSKVSSNGSYPNMSVGKADKLKLNDTTSLLATSFPVQITIGTDGVLHYKGYNSSGTGFVDLGTATVYACFS